MKHRIITTFTFVLLVVLALSFLSLYFVFYTMYIKEQETMLEHTIDLVDASISNQKKLDFFLEESDIRMTIIDQNGKVINDSTGKEYGNHSKRQEIKSAKKDGIGSDIRYSSSNSMNYLYVAKYFPNTKRFVRLAIPLDGLNESVARTLPLFIGLFLLAALLGYIFISKVSDSLLEPIHRISQKVRNKKDAPIKFDLYNYEELQEITSSIEEMDQKIYEQIERLNQDKKMRQQFFANASHELKTPLTSIQGYTELLQSGWLSEEQKQESMAHIHAESLKMSNLIQDILTISKLETHEKISQEEEIDLKELVEQTIQRLSLIGKEKNIHIRAHLSSCSIYAYKPYMEELVINLIKNALIYNRENGEVDITLHQEGRQVYFEVKDTGIGIPEAELSKIFKRFYRVDHQNRTGTGLGLSIVKNIVQYYQGTIDVRSQIGAGTSFTIRMPIVEGERKQYAQYDTL